MHPDEHPLELPPGTIRELQLGLKAPLDDPKQRQPDVAKARETFGWQPKVQLREGLIKTIAYFDGLMKEGDPLIVGR